MGGPARVSRHIVLRRAVKNELPSRSPLLASLCSLCRGALTRRDDRDNARRSPPKVERGETSRRVGKCKVT